MPSTAWSNQGSNCRQTGNDWASAEEAPEEGLWPPRLLWWLLLPPTAPTPY